MKICDCQAFRFHTPTDVASVTRTPRRPRRRRTSVLSLGVLAVVLTACEKGPVEWTDDTRQLALPVSGSEGPAGDAPRAFVESISAVPEPVFAWSSAV